ncbi:MAG: hypothetical protein EZS28_032461, partial [Streblomastix strix]
SVLKRFVIESSRILETHKLDVEKEREKNYSLKEKIRITNAKLVELEASINIDISKYEAGRVEPHRIKLMQAKQSIALMRAKIQAEEADYDDVTERAQQRRLTTEQRAADRNAAVKAAKEQAETQKFKLDRRRNLPTLYDKNVETIVFVRIFLLWQDPILRNSANALSHDASDEEHARRRNAKSPTFGQNASQDLYL